MTEGRVQSPCLYGRDPKDCSACQEAEAICAGRVLTPCPNGRTDYEACFAPFRYCPVKGCGRTEAPPPPFVPESDDLWGALWEYTQHWRASKDDATGQDARNVCEDERILSIHAGPDPDCSTCATRLPERTCHACHVPLNRCEWLLSLARRWFTGREHVQVIAPARNDR